MSDENEVRLPAFVCRSRAQDTVGGAPVSRLEKAVLVSETSIDLARPHYVLGDLTGLRRFDRGHDVLLVEVDGICVNWVLLECESHEPAQREADGTWTKLPDEYGKLAEGTGIAGALREPRHTWFEPTPGDGLIPGYTFYVKPRLIAWAFDCLREWFDFDDGEDDAAKTIAGLRANQSKLAQAQHAAKMDADSWKRRAERLVVCLKGALKCIEDNWEVGGPEDDADYQSWRAELLDDGNGGQCELDEVES